MMEAQVNSLSQFRWLFQFHRWARQRMVAAAKKLEDEDRRRPGVIPGGNEDGSIHAVLAHILGAEMVWLQRWTGYPTALLPGSSDFADLEMLECSGSEVEQKRSTWLKELKEPDLNRQVEYLSVTRGVIETFPLWQTLLHLSNHTTYHRGEVAAALSSLASPAESVDLIDYMRSCRDEGRSAW